MPNVSLGNWEAWIRRKVESGRFENASEVVRWACRVTDSLERRESPPGTPQGESELESLLLEGLESGPATPMTRERWDRLHALLKK